MEKLSIIDVSEGFEAGSFTALIDIVARRVTRTLFSIKREQEGYLDFVVVDIVSLAHFSVTIVIITICCDSG